MTTTFKFFRPNGDCRRVTFAAVPELAAINELVDGMVEAPAERRQLTYVDSEGDRVVIKTSRDVVEAVSDAREAGAKSIKVLIRPRGGGARCGGSTGAVRLPQGPQRGCGRGRRGLFTHPRELSKEFRDIVDVIGAIFPGIFVEAEAAKESGASGEAGATPADDSDAAAKDATSSTPATPSPPAEADKSATVSQAPTHESGAKVEDASDASTDAKEAKNASTSAGAETEEDAKEEDDLDAKAALLRDMGFELPLDVARNMIAEMGGRMDLIVRALVANAK